MTLRIGTDPSGKAFTLPPELVTQTVAILAKRGVGKTYTAGVMAEELLAAGGQVVVIDPTGAWWGLRSSADGKSEGYPVVVFGGDHGDLPLEEGAGELIAQAIVERGFSAIIDLSLLRKGQMIRFMTPFAETLYRLNRQPVHLIVDEADAVAPQRPFGDEARLLGAMEDLVRRGRKRGIGCTLISQRPAVLNKNVLTQCEMLVAMRLVHPKDIDAIEEWVNVHADPVQAKTMIVSLPSLPVGTAWFWSPGWGDVFQRVAVRARRTFDSSATPKPGQRVAAPKKLAAVDADALGKQISEMAERVRAENPGHLKRRVAELERQLAAGGKAAPRVAADPAAIDAAIKATVQRRDREWQRSLSNLWAPLAAHSKNTERVAGEGIRLAEQIGKLLADGPPATRLPEIYKTPPRPLVPASAVLAHPPSVAVPAARSQRGDGGLPRAERRILTALAQHGTCTKRKVAVLTGYAVGGGGFCNAICRCRAQGWLEGDSELAATAAGLEVLGGYDPLPVGGDLIAHWLGQLPKAEREILTVLAAAYPVALAKEQIAERTESAYEPSGGGFNNAVCRLRTLELITGRGELRLSHELGDGAEGKADA